MAKMSRSFFKSEDIIETPGVIVKSRGIIDVEYCAIPFTHKGEFWSYTPADESLNIRFLYYSLKSKVRYLRDYAARYSVKMPQISLVATEELELPIPPLPIQHIVVSVLDRLDSYVNNLSSGLPAEIEARQKQYEWWRDALLNFRHLDIP